MMRVLNKHEYLGVLLMLCVAGCVCLLLTRPLGASPGNRRGIRPVNEVMVAKKSLPAMSVVTGDDFVRQRVSRNELKPGQISSPTRVLGRVLSVPVVEGQILTESCFIEHGPGAQLVAALPEGMRAFTVNLDNRTSPDPILLYPGCVVDVLVSFKLGSGDPRGEAVTTTMLQGIQVLVVQDKSVVSNPQDEGAGEAKIRERNGGLQVTLLVNQKQAEALQEVVDHGNISLAIRDPLDKRMGDGAPKTVPAAPGNPRWGVTVIRDRASKTEESGPKDPNPPTESDPNTKTADRFKVSFVEAEYTTSTGRREQATQHLRLRCKVDILDPNLVLGISQRGTVTQIENDEGKIVDVADQPLSQSTGLRYSYEAPRYRSGPFVPSKPVRPAALKLRQLSSSEPPWVDVLEPVQMTLELDPGLLRWESRKINHVKGHFYALRAKSIEYIEIPFEPNEKWVRLIPDLEIQVLEAQSTESRYSYRIESRGEQAFRGWLHPGIDLPNRLPLGQELLDEDGKSVHSPSGGHPKLTASVGGKGSGGTTSVGGVEKISFVIAVNPSHHKIPFELDDIPLPSLPAASTEEPSRQQSK